MASQSTPDATRQRLLDATRVALAQYGPRKIALTDIARLAGVSRPTLYKHFPSKEVLLDALAAYEHRRFDEGMTAAVQGLVGDDRIDAALRFVVEHQAHDPIQHLVAVEPGFVLEQVAAAVDVMRKRMRILFQDAPSEQGLRATTDADDLADLVVRTALSHFLIPSRDRTRLLRELRAIAGIPAVNFTSA